MLICVSWQDFQCRTTLQELNAIPPILELLKSEYPIIQLLALKTLGVITCDKEARTTLKDNQGLDHLTKILETKVLTLSVLRRLPAWMLSVLVSRGYRSKPLIVV